MNFSPKSVTAVELNPTSVLSYNIKANVSGGVGDLFKNYPADVSGTTIIPIGDMFDESMVNKTAKLYAQQVGQSETSPYVQISGDLLISEIPNGAELYTVQT